MAPSSRAENHENRVEMVLPKLEVRKAKEVPRSHSLSWRDGHPSRRPWSSRNEPQSTLQLLSLHLHCHYSSLSHRHLTWTMATSVRVPRGNIGHSKRGDRRQLHEEVLNQRVGRMKGTDKRGLGHTMRGQLTFRGGPRCTAMTQSSPERASFKATFLGGPSRRT